MDIIKRQKRILGLLMLRNNKIKNVLNNNVENIKINQNNILELIILQNNAIKKFSNSNTEMLKNIKIGTVSKVVCNIDYEKLKKE